MPFSAQSRADSLTAMPSTSIVSPSLTWIADVTFIAADKRFEDDQALTRADEAVDALIGQL